MREIGMRLCTINDLQSGSKSEKNIPGIKLTNGTKHSSKEKSITKNVHGQGFSRGYVSTKAKAMTNGMTIHSDERMNIVDSGA